MAKVSVAAECNNCRRSLDAAFGHRPSLGDEHLCLPRAEIQDVPGITAGKVDAVNFLRELQGQTYAHPSESDSNWHAFRPRQLILYG